MSLFDSFLEVAGNLGFLVGDNDRRRLRERKERRSWGVEEDGFAVSVAANSLQPTADEPLRIEIALRNASLQDRQILVTPWLIFFVIEIIKPDGFVAELNNFGQRQIADAYMIESHLVTLSAGAMLEADIPVGALYSLQSPGIYKVRGKSIASSAVSHELQIRI